MADKYWPPDWPAVAEPRASARMRACPEDFEVVELPVCRPEGDGEHVWLRIRKRLVNTEAVARRLAKTCAVPVREVSFAGLKDRNAVTTQWFSVRLPRGAPDWAAFEMDGVEILETARHGRKLRRGALRGNHFRILLREIAGGAGDLPERLQRIREEGVPNYFGPQRFGRGGGNLGRALELFSGSRKRDSRTRRSLYLSAARSFLFNEVLAERVRRRTWNRLLPGETVQLAGSHSVFQLDTPDAESAGRCERQDIHPTGPLWGDGGLAGGICGELERGILECWPEFREGLREFGMKSDRRSLRMVIHDLTWEFNGAGDLVLAFRLPAGAYATSVIRELVEVRD